MDKKTNQHRQRAANTNINPPLHFNAAFRKAAGILLTDEGYQQIKDLAEHFTKPNNEASA